jgi:hypothetical protein
VIADTVHSAQALKSEASDVTGVAASAAGTDVLSLLEARDIVPRIEADVRQMLAAAQAAAPDIKPVFTVKELKAAEFVPPAAPVEGAPPPAEGAGAPAASLGRVPVTLVLATTHKDAVRFANKQLDGWLRVNAKRPGVPYEIVVPDKAVKVRQAQGDQTSTAPVPRVSTTPMPAAAPMGRSLPAEGGGRAGRGAALPQEMGRPAGMMTGEPTSAPPPGSRVDPHSAEAVRLLGSLAPLVAPAGQETGPVSTVTVTWEAVLVPKPAAPPGGAS